MPTGFSISQSPVGRWPSCFSCCPRSQRDKETRLRTIATARLSRCSVLHTKTFKENVLASSTVDCEPALLSLTRSGHAVRIFHAVPKQSFGRAVSDLGPGRDRADGPAG